MSSWLFLVAHNIACLQQAGNTYYFKTNHVWSGTLLSIVLYILHTLYQKYSESQDKTRACQGTIRCNCWPAILFVNKSQTYVCTLYTIQYTVASAPAETGSIFMRRFRLFLLRIGPRRVIV